MKTIYIIGRESDCDICLWDETNEVSRHHAQIRIDSKGKYWLMDTSTNGTYVNGLKITPGMEVCVNRDDEISFAHIENLDWSQIPRQKHTALIIIIACGVLLLGLVAGATWYLLHQSTTEEPSGMSTSAIEQVTDTATTVNQDTTAVEQKDSIKSNPQPAKKTKVEPKKDAQKQETPKEQPEEATESSPEKDKVYDPII